MSSQVEQTDTPVGEGADEVAEGLDKLGMGGDVEPSVDEGGNLSDSGDGGGGLSIRDRLLSSEPNPPLSEVENPWNPKEGGVTRVFRGLKKMGDITGLPAGVDILIGLVEEMHKRDDGESLAGDGDGEDEAEGDVEW